MKTLFYIFAALLLTGCASKRSITKTQHTVDTVIIQQLRTDTLIQIKEKIIEKPIHTELYLDCDSIGGGGQISSGETKIVWRYDTILKRYEVKTDCGGMITEKDSIISRLKSDLNTYVSRNEKASESETKEVRQFNWWMVAFICLFAFNVLYLIRK